MADIFDQLGFKPDTDAFAALGFQEDPEPPPAARPRTAYELDGPIPGTERTGLPPVRMIPPTGMLGADTPPPPPKPNVLDYLANRGNSPVRPPPAPERVPMGVKYDPLGARPEDGYYAATRAGIPTTPDQRPGGPGSMPYVGDELARAGAQSALGVVKGTGRGLRIASSGSPEGGGIGRAVGAGLEAVGEAGQKLIPPPSADTQAMVGKSWTDDPTQLFNPMYMAQQVGNAGGSMVAFMAPTISILGRVSTAAGAARAAAAMSVAESLANSAEVYDQAKAAGKTDAEAADLFRRNLPKDLPFTFITNKLGMFNEKIGSQVARTALGTGLEVGQEVGQGAIANQTLGKPLGEGAGENALGGFLGGPIGGVMSPVTEARSQMAPVEPLGPVPAPPLPPPEPAGMAPVEPLQAPVTQQQPVQPPPPPPPPPMDPQQIYAEAKALVASRPDAGTSLLAKNFGVSQDEARNMLEQMVQEGLLAPKILKGGTTTYVNLEKQRLRKGKPVIQKAIQLPPEVAPATPEVASQEQVAAPPDTLPADFGFVEDSRKEVVPEVAPEVAEGVPESPSVHTPSAPTPEESSEVRTGKESLQVQPPLVEIQPGPVERLQTPEPGSTEPLTPPSNESTIDASDVQPRATRKGTAVLESREPKTKPAHGSETDILIPGESGRYRARYSVRELEDVHPSHIGQSFQPNPTYQLKNERDYADPSNQERVVRNSAPDLFEPAYLVTDNPDVTNGPPAIDPQGNVLGGNSRGMILQRAYENPRSSERYKAKLAAEAARYGIDVNQIQGMKRPVLVREISEDELAKIPQGRKTVVRATNKTGTAALTASEQAKADAGQMSEEMANHIAGQLELAGNDATVSDLLSTSKGADVINRLVADGVFTTQEKSRLVDAKTGAVTSDAKQRVQKALVGRLFRDSDQLRRTPPSIVAKLERVVGPVMRLQGNQEFSIQEKVKEALDVLEFARAHDTQDLSDLTSQQGLFGNEPQFSDQAVRLAEAIRDRSPNEVSRVFKRYAANTVPTMFGESTQHEAFDEAFGGSTETKAASTETKQAITETKPAKTETKAPVAETITPPETKLSKAKAAADARLRKKGIATGGTAPANAFLDPAVIRDMAISIAGSIQSGVITAKNYVQQIVQRFGQGAARVARQVFRRGQAVAKQQGATPGVSQQHYTPHDPDVQKAMEAARVEPEEGALAKIIAAKDAIVHGFTRQFEHLESGARYAELRTWFNQVTKAKGTSTHRAAQAIVDQLQTLSKEEFSDFLYYVALSDLTSRVRQQTQEGMPVADKDLPFGFKSKVDLYRARKESRAVIDANPKLQKALALRRAIWDEVKPEYIAAMERAGHRVGDAVSRQNYFRHRVLEHLEAKNRIGQGGSGAGQRFKTPVGRGWLKKATVNPAAYSLDYIRAEFEVLSEMMYDTARADFIGKVADPKNGLNIALELKKKAAAHNKAAVMPVFAAMAKRHNKQNPGGRTHTAESMYQAVMKSHPKDPSYRRRLTKQLAGSQYIGTLEQAYNEFALQTHAIYQPIEGHHFFIASTISDEAAAAIEQAGVGEVEAREIRKQRVRGAKKAQLVLPREVVETMKEFMQPPKGKFAPVDRMMTKALTGWKQLKLIHPLSVTKYNIRNLSGDLERVVTTLPGALKYSGQALKEIRQYKKTGHPPTPEFKAWWSRGGMDANLQVAEIGEANRLDALEHLLINPNENAAQKLSRKVSNAWNATWGAGRKYTDIREGILRYATFLEFQKQVKSNPAGRPNTFGASLREEVMALRNRDDRAYKLSNDLMLAYDEVSSHGQVIRRLLIPFWSFQEQNARAYSRLVRNAVIDGRTAAGVGYAALGGVKAAANVGAWTAIRVGQTVGLAMGLKTLMTLFNWYGWGDEEDDLPESVKKDTHIILGRDPDGKVVAFPRIGLIDDLLEWAGLEAAPYYVREYLNGRMTVQEMAKEMAKSPANKLWGGITPVIKLPVEMVAGKATFPDVFSPRQIRDRGEYIARELGLLWVYKKLAGTPQKAVSPGAAADMVIYRYDPRETHYNAFRFDAVPKWSKEHGKGSAGGYAESRAAKALYNIRMSIRYEDGAALQKALEEYKDAGGARANIQKSIDRLHPLGSMSKKDRIAFEASLKPREKAQLQQAILFWKEHFDSKRAEVDRAAATSKLPLKRRKK